MNDADKWIEALQLQSHPEGGWFREIYRAPESVAAECLPSRFDGSRCFCTAIYFLLRGHEFSALHRIRQDELWHFYDGSALTIHQIDPAGTYSTATLGRKVSASESLTVVVPAGWLFGATVNDAASWSLVGCTVAPGFEFDDFQMPDRADILQQYPQHRRMIEQLTR